MTPRLVWGARAAGLAAVFGGGLYLSWRARQLAQLGVPADVFFAAELANYLALVAAVALFWTVRRRPAPPPPPVGDTDVLIPVCGEDPEIVEPTLRAALAIEYPHRTIVLCDSRMAGFENWREIVALCHAYQVPCLVRGSGSSGKAGNLNAALPRTHGEFIVVLDADHVARPELGELLLGYFEDPKVAFVTSRQSFRLEGGDPLGHQEALFYGSIQPAKDHDNAAFSCGSGVAYRRSAIEQLGGFSEWNLVEDLHTSYELHARGWRSVYVGTPVSVGAAPATAAEMGGQRLRWATDSLRILFWDNPLRKRGLSLRQRLHYLHTTVWYLVAAAYMVFLLSPIASILLGARLLVPGTEGTYALLLLAYLGPVALMLAAHVGWRAALRTAQLQAFLAPVFGAAIVRALLASPHRRARRLESGVTRKSHQRQMSWITTFQHTVLTLLVISIGVSLARPGVASWAVVLWACVLAAALATPASMLGLHHQTMQSLRIAITAPAIAAAVLVALTVLASGSLTARGAATQDRAGAPVTRLASLVPSRAGIYLGVFHPSVAGPPRRPVRLRRYSGARLRILHRFQAWWGPDRYLGPAWLAAVARHGAVPMVSWEPWRKPHGGVAAPTQRRGIVRRIARGRYDAYIRRWARDARRYGKPLIIRLMHEMNGQWYPWSVHANGNNPAAFKAAWRRVHRIFTLAGATNVSWVFSVDALAGGRPTRRWQLDQYYPGSSFVDWIGLSGFNWSRSRFGGVLSFDRVFRPTYEIVKRYGKPVMLAETGTAAADTRTAPAWVRDAMTSTPRRFPRVKALVWFDAPHPQRDFTLRGRALREFRADARRPTMRPPLRLITR